jgi:ankyrin repeat protein
VRGGHKILAEFLIRKGANVNAVNEKNGLSPLHCAVKADNEEMVEVLLNNGADINLRDTGRLASGRTPLHFAAHECNDRIADLLLSRGADVSCVDSWGRTPLHWAAIENCTTLAHLLLAKGAEVNKRDNFRRHALSLASSHSSKEMVELLIESDAEIMQGDEDGYTPLHWASTREIAEVLIANNASLKAASDRGLLPIHKACIEGKMEVVEFFIANGESVETENHTGLRPLHVAALEGQTDVIRLLISQGALIDAKDHDYWTPLHYAAFKGKQESARVLIDNGANVNSRAIDSYTPLNRIVHFGRYTPLHLAAHFGFKEMVELLIRAGASIEALRHEGGTRLFFGIETPYFSRLFPASELYFCELYYHEGVLFLFESSISTLLVSGRDSEFINTDELAVQWISQAKLGAKLQGRDLPSEVVHIFAEIRGYSISLNKPEGENQVWAEVRPEPKEQPTDWTFTIEEKEDCWLTYCTLREENHPRYRRYIITVGKEGSIQDISKVTIYVQDSPWIKRNSW